MEPKITVFLNEKRFHVTLYEPLGEILKIVIKDTHNGKTWCRNYNEKPWHLEPKEIYALIKGDMDDNGDLSDQIELTIDQGDGSTLNLLFFYNSNYEKFQRRVLIEMKLKSSPICEATYEKLFLCEKALEKQETALAKNAEPFDNIRQELALLMSRQNDHKGEICGYVFFAMLFNVLAVVFALGVLQKP